MWSIYDYDYDYSFNLKMESIEFNAALSIASAIVGTSRENLYQQLGLESLPKKRWYRKLCYFLKIFEV